MARSVGELVGSDLSAAPYSLTPSEIQGLVQSIGTTRGYIAIYTGIASASGVEKRIVGYGYCDLAGASGGVVTVKRGWQNQDDSSACQVTVAPDNASASLGRNSPALSREQWNAVFEQNIQFVYPTGVPSYRWQDIRPWTALAPALVR
ncbi:MAG: hypothetical protein IPJ77_10600 [Planctomycetes bacterium]|nr:hypothetical protein [Planctomycetota bacterium]